MSNITELVTELQEASDLYYNGGKSPLSDAEYDAKENQLRKLDPANVFLTGIGADVHGDKVPLPFTMGSLDQVKENDTLKWVKAKGLEDEDMVVTSKEDGNSIQIVYGDTGDLQIAYSRGNGKVGQDMTRHVRRMKKVPQKVSQKMAIAAEVIMADDVFDQLNASGALDMKNARNYVSGQMNSSESDATFYDNVDIVAFKILKFG